MTTTNLTNAQVAAVVAALTKQAQADQAVVAQATKWNDTDTQAKVGAELAATQAALAAFGAAQAPVAFAV